MTVDTIREFCLALNGTTESIKWDDHVCFSVGDKMYLVVNPDQFPVNASFKTSETLFDELTARDGMIPAPYMAKHKWVFLDDISRLADKEWVVLIRTAYTLTLQKLPKKTQKLLGDT